MITSPRNPKRALTNSLLERRWCREPGRVACCGTVRLTVAWRGGCDRVAGWDDDTASYAGHRFPAEIISHAVWLYFRFPLSLCHVDEILAARGITVSHD
jgi:hypothetical protein